MDLHVDQEKENVYSLGLLILYMSMPFDYKGLYFDEREFLEDGMFNWGVEFDKYYSVIDHMDTQFNFEQTNPVSGSGIYDVDSEDISKYDNILVNFKKSQKKVATNRTA